MRLWKSLDASHKKDDDTADSDLQAFCETATSEAAMRAFIAAKFLMIFVVCVLPFSVRRDPASNRLCLLAACASLMCLLAKDFVCLHLKKRPVLVGCGIQLCGHLFWGVFPALMCPSTSSEAARHRMYLSTVIPLFLVSTVGGYLPPLIFGCCACPIFFTGWLIFHHMVSFLNPIVVIYGVFLCGAAVVVSYLLHKRNYQIFQMTRQLETEHSLLAASQATLQAMLSSIFDASAFCNSGGELSKVTPQLQELLGNRDQIHGTCLWNYASSESERSRLRDFLLGAPETAIHQAAKIHVLLRQGMTGHDFRTLEVSLYAVKLVRASAQLSSREQLFLGFQVQSVVEGEHVTHSAQDAADAGQLDDASTATAQTFHVSEASFRALDSDQQFFHDASNTETDDSSTLPSLASQWSLSPADFVVTESPEISKISFVVDALSKNLSIQRITFDFASEKATGGKLAVPPAVASFMPVSLWAGFFSEVQDALNARANAQAMPTLGPAFLKLPSHLTGAQEVMLRADKITLSVGCDEHTQQKPHVSASEESGSSKSDESEDEDWSCVTLELTEFWKVNVPRVNPKRLRRKRSSKHPRASPSGAGRAQASPSGSARHSESLQLPVIKELHSSSEQVV